MPRLTLLSDAVFRWLFQFSQFSRPATVAREHSRVEAFQGVDDGAASRSVFVELQKSLSFYCSVNVFKYISVYFYIVRASNISRP